MPALTRPIHRSAPEISTALSLLILWLVLFNPTLTIGANDQAIEVVNISRSTAGTAARTINSWGGGWATSGSYFSFSSTKAGTSGPTMSAYFRERSVTGAASDGSRHRVSNTATWDSMTAMSIRVGPSDSTPPTVGTVTVTPTSTTFTTATPTITATLTDAESTVTSCQYCVATDGTCDTEWTGAT